MKWIAIKEVIMIEGFGKLKLLDVRDKWPNEATDFNPWLAKDENLSELGSALGIDLEFEDTEVPIGPYSADILAKDAGTGRYVVIENQLGKTDHDHLGKSLTYASILNATVVVWIAGDFTEEHKKTLDWLNDVTSEEVTFFGVRLELWQIDNSKPAFRFNIISRPVGIIKPPPPPESDAKKLQLEFWTELRKRLLESKEFPSLQTPRPQYWYDVSLGRAGINISNTANTFDNKIGIRVYISNKIANVVLPQLMNDQKKIEEEIGQELHWNPYPEKRDKIISLLRDADLKKKENWDEYINWLVDKNIKFRSVFSKRIKQLDFSQKLDNTDEIEDEAEGHEGTIVRCA